MADNVITSFGVLNYSGLLFNKGNTRTPFLTMIGGHQKVTNHVEFVTGQEYTGGGDGSQPAISETASLTAPDATSVTRSQKTNVTQIFMESVYISYAKQSNMGTLAGINIANQVANPMNELDFQVNVKMQKIARDLEYTCINGKFAKATGDGIANQTRGMVEAIETNVTDLGGKAITVNDIVAMMKKVHDSQAPTHGLILWADSTTILQINDDCKVNGLTVVPASRNVNGIDVSEIITPFGNVGVYLGECLPEGTALLLNFDVIAPVHQPVPGKGNFFMEKLAITGAGEKHQIFGQMGLDHGPEWYHGKITGINTTFEPKAYSAVVKTISE
jgi:hypothetical protein